jgi:SNF2 family DNA or RNA helicase
MDFEPYLHRFQFTPFQHQLVGVQHLIEHAFCGLFDDMGAGKTKQTIDASQIMFDMGLINRVIIVAPASVRSVWFDSELGQIRAHGWNDLRHIVSEFHSRIRQWRQGPEDAPELRWIITNYEFIRSKDRVKQLLRYCGPKTLLVLDESSAVKSHRSMQFKACLKLRKKCGRVVLLNGTPYENSPGDIYSQCDIMSPSILDCSTWSHFKSRYAKVKTIHTNIKVEVIVGWHNLDDLKSRVAPFVIRRLKKDCIDLPEKMAPVPLEVPLLPATWKIYKEMKTEMVAWLSSQVAASSMIAATKIVRLAQITSGFVGGVERLIDENDIDQNERPDFMRPIVEKSQMMFDDLEPINTDGTRFISREKLDFFLDWLNERLESDRQLKVLVWCRFKPELLRLVEEVKAMGGFTVHAFHGGQTKTEREEALRAMDPRTAPYGPQILAATMGTGGRGINATAFHIAVNLSNDYSWGKYAQSTDRIHRPGQLHSCSYFDLVAVGPQGQRTIDHAILAARAAKADMAEWTTRAWIRALQDEGEGDRGTPNAPEG